MRFVPIGASVVTALLVTALAATSLWPNGSLAEAEEPQIIDISVIGPPYQWSPTNYTIFAGTTVKWTASGAAPHTVTSEGCLDSRIGPCTFDSGAGASDYLRAGTAKSSFQYKFDKPGVYPFICRLHGGIGGAGQFGVIVVYDAGQAPPSGNYKAPADLVARINAEKASPAAAAAGPSIQPPSTGEAGLQGPATDDEGSFRLLVAFILIAAAPVSILVLHRKLAT